MSTFTTILFTIMLVANFLFTLILFIRMKWMKHDLKRSIKRYVIRLAKYGLQEDTELGGQAHPADHQAQPKKSPPHPEYSTFQKRHEELSELDERLRMYTSIADRRREANEEQTTEERQGLFAVKMDIRSQERMLEFVIERLDKKLTPEERKPSWFPPSY